MLPPAQEAPCLLGLDFVLHPEGAGRRDGDVLPVLTLFPFEGGDEHPPVGNVDEAEPHLLGLIHQPEVHDLVAEVVGAGDHARDGGGGGGGGGGGHALS